MIRSRGKWVNYDDETVLAELRTIPHQDRGQLLFAMERYAKGDVSGITFKDYGGLYMLKKNGLSGRILFFAINRADGTKLVAVLAYRKEVDEAPISQVSAARQRFMAYVEACKLEDNCNPLADPLRSVSKVAQLYSKTKHEPNPNSNAKDGLALLIKDSIDNDPGFADVWAPLALVSQLFNERIRLGLSRADVAMRMGLASSAIVNIENDPTSIGLARILAYARSLGVEILARPQARVKDGQTKKGKASSGL